MRTHHEHDVVADPITANRNAVHPHTAVYLTQPRTYHSYDHTASVPRKNTTVWSFSVSMLCAIQKCRYLLTYCRFQMKQSRAICSVSLSNMLLLCEYWCYGKGEHSSEILSMSWVQIRGASELVSNHGEMNLWYEAKDPGKLEEGTFWGVNP